MARPNYPGVFRLEPFEPWEDIDAAPGAYQGDGAAPPFTRQRARQNTMWIYAVGLIFLVFSFGAVFEPPVTPIGMAARIIALSGLAAAYLCTAWVCDLSLALRWCYLAFFVGLLISTSLFMGWGFIYYGIYVMVMLATLIPWRQARLGILVVGLLVIALAMLTREWAAVSIGLTGLFVGFASGGAMEAARLARKLDRSRQRVSVLAVAAERERIGRDLHDILGHSLTAISIKAGLAAKLVARDPTAAEAEIADIAEIARHALGDVRSTASGFREVRVATEVASARSVLLAAGIDAITPSAIEPLPPEVSELFGYVVREAVTNVVRHSDATACTIEVSRQALVVRDDGNGFAPSAERCGSGLRGLRRRVESAGGQLTVESRPAAGTVIRAELRAADPSASQAGLVPVSQP